MLLMYLVWKVLKKTKMVKLSEMDLETDVYLVEDEEPEKKGWQGRTKRVVNWIF